MAAPRNNTLKRLSFGVIFLLLFSELISFPYASATPLVLTSVASSSGSIAPIRSVLITHDGWTYAFYKNPDNNVYYKSSNNNIDFNAEQQASAHTIQTGYENSNGATIEYPAFSVYTYFYNGKNVILISYQSIVSSVVRYYLRNGTASNGLITWGTEELEYSVSGSVAVNPSPPAIITTNNYIYLAVYRHDTSNDYVNIYNFTKTCITAVASCRTLVSWLVTAVTTGTYGASIDIARFPSESDGVVIVTGSYSKSTYSYYHTNGLGGVNTGDIGTKSGSLTPMNSFSLVSNSITGFVYFAFTPNNNAGILRYMVYSGGVTWSAQATVAGTAQTPRLIDVDETTFKELRVFYTISNTEVRYLKYSLTNSSWQSEGDYTTLDVAPVNINMLSVPLFTNTTLPVIFRKFANSNVYFSYDSLPSILEGIIGCRPSNAIVNLTGKQTYIYIASSAPSIYINYTYLNIVNYSNNKGDAWITVTLYGVSNSNPISSVNPLTALWQETTLVHNNTINTPIVNTPNIETKENQYIGVAVSSTEDIQVNGTADVCNLYKYPVYAPYSIEYLITNATKIGLYAKYKQATPATTSFIASISTTTTRQYNIINNLNNIMVGMSIPPFFGYALFFMGTLFGSYIYINRAREENYINAGIPILALVIIGFAVFAVYTLINGIPFELLIAVAVMIVGLFASLILGVFMSKDDT